MVRAAFRLLEEQDELQQAKIGMMREAILKGIDNGEAEAWDKDAFFKKKAPALTEQAKKGD